jgi:hypothetical protein
MSKTLFTQVQYDLNGLMNAVKMTGHATNHALGKHSRGTLSNRYLSASGGNRSSVIRKRYCSFLEQMPGTSHSR